ncbi:MAG: hypothetical protein JSR82_02070 [Verrucomicrobia bacterium]|nr:hypothetical protein [Verrucomicrobiota bacterium]
MNTRSLCAALLGALALTAAAPAATFQVITIRGTLTSVQGPWDSSVAVGTPYVATIRVDVAARDLDSSPTFGSYISESSPMTAQFGNYNVASASSKVQITNATTGDAYEFESEDGQNFGAFTDLKLNVALESNNAALLANDQLPVQVFPVSSFNNQRRFRVRTDQGELRGGVDSYTIETLTQTAPSNTKRLINVSTRARVQPGEDRVIAGFVITGADPKRVLVRALGPTLAAFGVTNALTNPTIEIRNASGALLAQNDNWQDTQAADINATQFAPPNANESAAILTLPAGSYTVIVSGVGNTSGVTLVEVYEL